MADILTQADINATALKKLFDDAFMITKIEDGDLRVEEEGLGCHVLPINNGDRIKLLTLWNARAKCSESQRLEFANRVNDGIITVRVSVSGDLIFFDYYIPVEGGISGKAVVLATKHFLAVQKLAVQECGGLEVLESAC